MHDWFCSETLSMFVKVTHIKWDINKVLDWKCIECVLYLITVKISCTM